MRAGRYFSGLGDRVSGASSLQCGGIGFPRRGETVNAKFTGINAREQPESDHAARYCFLSGVVLHL